MNRTPKYVAFDVHQATTVASVRDHSGRVINRSILATDAAALSEFVSGMRGSVSVVFEEGTQAQWLYDLLRPLAERVIVCDRRGEQRGSKNDRRDADHLSRRLLSGDLRAVYHRLDSRGARREPAEFNSQLQRQIRTFNVPISKLRHAESTREFLHSQ